MMQNRSSFSCSQTPGMVHGVSQQMSDVYPVNTALRRGKQAAAFAAWELRLYLNTHPEDTGALHFYQQLCEQIPHPNYACSFVNCHNAAKWCWVDDPWPWELCANERRA